MKAFFRRLLGRDTPVLGDASPRDARAISYLHAASFHRGWSEDELEQLLLDPNVLAQRATDGTTLCGFILSRIAADEAEILSIAVARAVRGRGLARKLLRLHLGRLAGLSVVTVFLEVDEDNLPARRLYDREGFQEVGRREGYYADNSAKGATALILRRDLS